MKDDSQDKAPSRRYGNDTVPETGGDGFFHVKCKMRQQRVLPNPKVALCCSLINRNIS